MGRLLRERKISAVGAKRTRAQSHLSNCKAPKSRQVLSDKTNNSGKVLLGSNILPLAVTTTRSRAKSFMTSCSENDSPNGQCSMKNSKPKGQARADELIGIENDLCPTTFFTKRRARNPLGDKTNSSENESPVNNLRSARKKLEERDRSLNLSNNVIGGDFSERTPMEMTLRKRKNQNPSAENSSSKVLLTNERKSFNRSTLSTPQAPSGSKKKTSSSLKLSSERLSNSFVQLEDVTKLVQFHNENKKSAKKPIYQTIPEDDNNDKEMLPEEKIKLYEYEIDVNSPKKVKVKRKRKPRKKVVISDSEESSNEGKSSVRPVTKRQRTQPTSSPLKKKADEADSFKKTSVHPIPTQVLSPIISSDRAVKLPPKSVKFVGHLPSANSTPNSGETMKDPLPGKALRFSQKEISTPVSKITFRRQIKKSIYVNPSAIPELHSSADISIASEINTTDNNTAHPINSPSDSLKQTKINSFFSTSARSGNDTGEPASHNNSGLFDELPSRSNSERMSTTAASTASQFVTVRRKALYHARPRISGLEVTPTPLKPLPPMTIENCFGFDDDNNAEDTFIPPSNHYRSLPLSVTFRAVCSTPITAPQPIRIGIQTLPHPVPKKTVKLPKPPQPILKHPVPLPVAEILAASTSEYTSQSPPLILSDPETLTPVTFGDEPSNFFKPARRSYQRTPRPKPDYVEPVTDEEEEALAVAKKPKKKTKQYLRKKKQEEDNWASSINRQFEEIEEVDLVVE